MKIRGSGELYEMEQTEDLTLHPTVPTMAPASGNYVVYVTSCSEHPLTLKAMILDQTSTVHVIILPYKPSKIVVSILYSNSWKLMSIR